MPAKKKKPARKKKSAIKRKPAPKKTASKQPRARRSKPATSASKRNSAPQSASLWDVLSAERKTDMLGVLISLVGLLTLLSLFSANRSSITGAWILFWSHALGWSVFLFPLTLLVVGLWMILRDVERVPDLSAVRVLGVFTLFLDVLGWSHFFLFPENHQAAYALAANGQGGGYIGAAIQQALITAIGAWGTVAVLFAALFSSLALIMDVSVVDLFRWVPVVLLRLQDWWDERQAALPQSPRFTGESAFSGAAVEASRMPADKMLSSGQPAAVDTPSLESEPRPWVLPVVADILDEGIQLSVDDEMDRQRVQLIEQTLASFGAPSRVVEVNRGPTITQFGVEPDFVERGGRRTRVRVGKIAALADDLALALAAQRIRIQAPVPGKGFVGIEVPNEEVHLVAMRDIVESAAFQKMRSPLRIALGQDVSGRAVAADLAAMPHILIAGATGAGKSVCVNALVCCMLLNNTPDDLRLLMVDPKRVELTGYNGIPHLLAPVVVELDRVVGALQWVTREMDSRYQKFAEEGARNLEDYNARLLARGQKKLPYLVVVIDELADLMMLAPDETERTLTRLAQLARATGIHLMISTQRPSVNVVTGLIKANFPARIAFAVASNTDSRVILDQPGAERLLGRGDMLFQSPDAPAPERLQGVYLSESEITRLVQYWRGFNGLAQTAPMAVGGAPDALPAGIPLKQKPLWEDMEPEEKKDPVYDEAVNLVRRQGRASISMLQRRLRIGYTRAARIIETMEEKGVISPPQPNSNTREVLDYGDTAPPAED